MWSLYIIAVWVDKKAFGLMPDPLSSKLKLLTSVVCVFVYEVCLCKPALNLRSILECSYCS